MADKGEVKGEVGTGRQEVTPAGPLRTNPTWWRWLAAASLARLPQTMLPVALVLTAHAATGSFVGSGLLSGASALTYAVCAPWRGRQMDRATLPRALGWSLLGSTAGLVTTAIAAAAGAPLGVLLVLVVVAAGCGAGVTGAYRSLLPYVLHPAHLKQAYAIDAVAVQLAWIGGPALASVVAALVGPQACVGAVAAVVATGALLSSTLPRREPVSDSRQSTPVRTMLVRLWVPLLLNAGIGVNLGALDVALPALLAGHGRPTTQGGLVLAGIFATSAVSGSVYAALPATAPLRRARTLTVAWTLTAVYGLLIAVAAGMPALWLALACFLTAGLAFAPGDTAAMLLVPEQIEEDRLAEAFGYFAAFGYLGTAAAGPVAGWLVTHFGAEAGLLLAGLAPLLSALVVPLTRLRRN
ncbi:MFS transporter [Streptomyces olivaceiscleroticus]|uniref:MFS transporter n=1 Tax=Streptomyces olivaceiscleroticus TaxID=68245 RepID=UPI0031F9DB1C